YVKQFRVEKAAELLRSTRLKTGEIGMECGFADGSYFIKTFRESTAAHAQTQQDRGEEGHQGIGGPHRRQRIRAEEAAHHPGVGNV
ncbi:helix-turn-helix domain-containing protein, partial [Faecalibacterium duncaniae]|uniref:helix-turn-helix domain-containing protein n=1 Tax=Faecalibacterium duncaniae (strain DSM 17677 / JCM 31915 / A2-165) TaxID=411483 RepID=UPI00294074FB|nr:hypothetical protein [Faecalibacterium duncaniae]